MNDEYVGEDGLPIHLPMLVTWDGRGPCDDNDPNGHHYVCWCRTDCAWSRALHDQFRLGLKAGW